MKAQQAPAPGAAIWSQHCILESAVEMEFVTLHSKNGGIIAHNNKKDIIVSTVFRGDENKFFLAQAIGPLVLVGGGQSGWVPGKKFFGVVLFTFNLRYRSTSAILRLNQFINAEIISEKNK